MLRCAWQSPCCEHFSATLSWFQGNMPALLSHYRPDYPIYCFTENRAVQRRLALYHGVTALNMKFLPDADATFEKSVTVAVFLFSKSATCHARELVMGIVARGSHELIMMGLV
jgi:pyruvate kinase